MVTSLKLVDLESARLAVLERDTKGSAGEGPSPRHGSGSGKQPRPTRCTVTGSATTRSGASAGSAGLPGTCRRPARTCVPTTSERKTCCAKGYAVNGYVTETRSPSDRVAPCTRHTGHAGQDVDLLRPVREIVENGGVVEVSVFGQGRGGGGRIGSRGAILTGGGPRSPDVRVVAALADPRRAVLVAPWWAFAADPTTALLALASHARQRSHLPATAPSGDHDRVCAALPKVRIWCTRADRYPSMLPAMWPRGCRRWRGASSSSWTGWTRPDVTTPNALPSWRSTSVCARPPDHQDRFEVGPWSENLADSYVALGPGGRRGPHHPQRDRVGATARVPRCCASWPRS